MTIALILALLALAAAALANGDLALLGAVALMAAAAALHWRLATTPARRRAVTDITAAIAIPLLAWQLLSANLKLADTILFPPPNTIIRLFFSELPDMASGLLSSLHLLGTAYLLALATAIPAGLAVGHSQRLQAAAGPFSKILGAIPPIVYIPYAIALLPSFDAASIFVIYAGAFWPIFANTVSGVATIPSSLLDSARMLHLPTLTLFRKVLLPGAMPAILTGASLGLILSFILLTAAELIGATEGLGWYVKNFSDFADYERVIVGIIFIGIVVTLLMAILNRIERHLLRHRRNSHD
ncbi:MAG: ABC transporter permease [Oligosphaeraceae bacterium]